MARNYTIAEAVQIITEGQDDEALMDLGKRYPLLTQKITRVAVRAGEDFVDLMSFMPEHISANKINSAIKRTLEEASGADDADDEDEEPKKKAPVKKSNGKAGRPKKVQDDEEEEDEEEQEAGSYDYESMNNAKMYKLLGELGKRKDCKEKYGDLSHDSMLKYLKKYGPKSDASGEEDDEEESGDEYEGKTAVELYKLCKQRKIKAEQKKPAKYYIGLLKKADEEAQADEDADAEDEWDEDEEEETPKKKAPAKKAPAKKAPKKAEPEEEEDEEEDDDEWEI